MIDLSGDLLGGFRGILTIQPTEAAKNIQESSLSVDTLL